MYTLKKKKDEKRHIQREREREREKYDCCCLCRPVFFSVSVIVERKKKGKKTEGRNNRRQLEQMAR
jgi:hypothetical protein